MYDKYYESFLISQILRASKTKKHARGLLLKLNYKCYNGISTRWAQANRIISKCAIVKIEDRQTCESNCCTSESTSEFKLLLLENYLT